MGWNHKITFLYNLQSWPVNPPTPPIRENMTTPNTPALSIQQSYGYASLWGSLLHIQKCKHTLNVYNIRPSQIINSNLVNYKTKISMNFEEGIYIK